MRRQETARACQMKAALLKRLQRLEEVQATESRPLEVQFGYLKETPADYTGERHVVTLGAIRTANTSGKSSLVRRRCRTSRTIRNKSTSSME
jgi:hypothetical protein